MQKEPNNIEDLFKSNLEHFEVNAPLFVKSNIDKTLFTNKLYLFGFLSIVILISTVSIFTYNYNFKSNNKITKNSIDTSIVSSQSMIVQEVNPNNATNIHSEKITLHVVDTQPDFSRNNKTSLLKKENNNQTSLKNNSNNNLNHKLNPNNNNKLPHQSKKEPISFILNVDSNNSNVTKAENNYETETILNKTNQQYVAESDETENDILIIESTPNFYYINKIDRFTNTPKHTSELAEITNIIKPKKLNLLIGLSAGINLSQVNYFALNKTTEDIYNNNKEAITYDFNLTTDLILKKNIILGTGVSLTKQKYEFNYNIITETPMLNYADSIELVYNPADTLLGIPASTDTIFHTSTIPDTVGYSTENTVHSGNSIASYLQIPIRFGYMFNYSKFSVGLQANLNYNLLLNSIGSIYANNSISNFDGNQNSLFKKSYFNLSFETNLYYKLSRNLYVNTHLKYSPKTNNVYSSLDVTRKIQKLNFGIGISYKF